MNKLFLPYDVYERHRKIGSQINNSETVLDVGGELNQLNKFCHPQKLVVANLNTGDVIIKKNELPFKPRSFDVVCAIDVLEHVPKIKREQFIKRLLDVASKKVILSFPVYTTLHEKYEKETILWLREHGQDVSYLEEHVKLGLPKESEVIEMTKNYKCQLSYSGNVLFNKIIFRFYMFDPKIKFIRKFLYYFKLFIYMLSNEILFHLLSEKKYLSSINRAYVTIYKKSK